MQAQIEFNYTSTLGHQFRQNLETRTNTSVFRQLRMKFEWGVLTTCSIYDSKTILSTVFELSAMKRPCQKSKLDFQFLEEQSSNPRCQLGVKKEKPFIRKLLRS